MKNGMSECKFKLLSDGVGENQNENRENECRW